MNNTGKKFGGRQKNTPNKTTKELRDKISSIINNNIDKVQTDLDKLEPKDRLNILLQLVKYVTPQLKAMEVETTIQDNNNRFNPIVIEYKDETERN
jgi:hypothetical protein